MVRGIVGSTPGNPEVLSSLFAQEDSGAESPAPSAMAAPANLGTKLRADVDLVLVNVTVLDSEQKALTGLRKEDFQF